MQRSIFLAGLLAGLTAAGAGASGRPPVYESVDLCLVTLNRLTLVPAKRRTPGLLPLKAKELPRSVRPYLRPTWQIDIYSRAVGRAAAQVRRAVAPRSADKDALRDSRRVAHAVGLWLDTHLALAPSSQVRRPSLDQRLAYPKVSAMLQAGRTDVDGRALAAVALLRALKVPARIATARGNLTVQYWVREVPAHRPKRRSARARRHGPKTPWGWWECLDPTISDAEIDAWSMDASSLARVRWSPKQDLDVGLTGFERAVFPEGASASAEAAFDASLAAGHLSACAGAEDLSDAAGSAALSLTTGSRTLWVLTAQPWRLRAEGVLMGLRSVRILTPYRPDLPDWGREDPGSLRCDEVVKQGVWSDRPGRLRLHKDLADDWSSPPPALGILHAYDLGVARSADVVQAGRGPAGVQGVVLRRDNLAARRNWTVRVAAPDCSATAQARVDARGDFSLSLPPCLAGADALAVHVDGPQGEDPGDVQWILKESHDSE